MRPSEELGMGKCHLLCQRSHRPTLDMMGAPAPNSVSRGSLHLALYQVGPRATHSKRRSLLPVPYESQQKVPGEDPLSSPLLPPLTQEPEVSRTSSSYSEFCSQKKSKKRERSNMSKPLSSADLELRGPRAICIPVCGGLRDTDDKLGSQCCAPTCGRLDGSFPSLSSKEGPWQHPGHHHTILRGPGRHTRASPHPTVRGQKKPASASLCTVGSKCFFSDLTIV